MSPSPLPFDLDEAFTAKFTLGEKLGAGAMGTVYRGTQLSLNRSVAIKFLSEGLARDPGCRQRFTSEAVMAARLAHTNLVAVHDHGEVSGRPYIVFEFVAGRSLRGRMDEGPMSAREALEMAAQVCEGLKYAHAAGIVHRDIKPENLLVTAEGVVKIADFGVAKDLLDDLHATQPGAIVGTPLYLAPEQAEGKKATAASDLYAVGTVMYEVMTGQLPFDGGSFVDLLRRKLSDRPPRADVVNPCVPARVGALVDVALERDPALRYPSAEAFGLAVKKALMLPEVNATPRGTAVAPSPGRRISRGSARTRAAPDTLMHVPERPSNPRVSAPIELRRGWNRPLVASGVALALLVALGGTGLAVRHRLAARRERPPRPAVEYRAGVPETPPVSLASDALPSGSATTFAAVETPATPMPVPVANPADERHERESGLDWLRRVPWSCKAFLAARAERATPEAIEEILTRRTKFDARACLFLAKMRQEQADVTRTARYMGETLEQMVDGFASEPELRGMFEQVGRWLGDVMLTSEGFGRGAAPASSLEETLRRGRGLLDSGKAREALALLLQLRERGFPERGLYLSLGIACLKAGDGFGAVLNGAGYSSSPGLEGTEAAALFLASEGLSMLELPGLATRARDRSQALSPPAASLQRLLEWETRLSERQQEEPPSAPEWKLVKNLPQGEWMSREEWLGRGWPQSAFERLAGNGALKIELGKPLLERIKERFKALKEDGPWRE